MCVELLAVWTEWRIDNNNLLLLSLLLALLELLALVRCYVVWQPKKKKLNMCLMFSTNIVRNYLFVSLNWLAGICFCFFISSFHSNSSAPLLAEHCAFSMLAERRFTFIFLWSQQLQHLDYALVWAQLVVHMIQDPIKCGWNNKTLIKMWWLCARDTHTPRMRHNGMQAIEVHFRCRCRFVLLVVCYFWQQICNMNSAVNIWFVIN